MKRTHTQPLMAAMLLALACGLWISRDGRAQEGNCPSCSGATAHVGDSYLGDTSPVSAYVGDGYGGAGGGLCARHHRPDVSRPCVPWEYGRPDLFYNFYVPNNCGGAPAAMYLAPRPVPELVGHTYYTYQPFLPHEMLYPHHRTYRNWYDGGRGMTRTHATWYHAPVVTLVKDIHHAIRLPR